MLTYLLYVALFRVAVSAINLAKINFCLDAFVSFCCYRQFRLKLASDVFQRPRVLRLIELADKNDKHLSFLLSVCMLRFFVRLFCCRILQNQF